MASSPDPGLASNSSSPCDDRVDGSGQASPPIPPSGDSVLIGAGDVFFIGTRGRRWGENVEAYGGAYQMKVGIMVLGAQAPEVSVTRREGAVTGTAQFAPTGAGLPGPLPTAVTFPTAGCWIVTARGVNGAASILVSIGSSAPAG